jgi:hypothetical protein
MGGGQKQNPKRDQYQIGKEEQLDENFPDLEGD